MRSLFIVGLIIGLGILASLPFRRDPSLPNPLTEPAQATGPTQSALFEKRMDLAIDPAVAPEFKSLGLPQEPRRPVPVDKKLQVPASYEDLAVPLSNNGVAPGKTEQKFSATVEAQQRKARKLSQASKLEPRMRSFAANAPAKLPAAEKSILANRSSKPARQPSRTNVGGKKRQAGNTSLQVAKKRNLNLDRKQFDDETLSAAAMPNPATKQLPKADAKPAEEQVSFGSSFARLEKKRMSKPRRGEAPAERQIMKLASTNPAATEEIAERLLGSSEQQLPKPAPDRERHWIRQP